MITFYITLAVFWVMGIIWIYFQGGAEDFVKYSASQGKNQPIFTKSTLGVKIMFALGLMGGIMAIVVLSIIDAPIPTFSE